MYENKDFVHLHNHTEYSLLDGTINVEDYASKAKEMGFKALAITDHGNTYGTYKFFKACKKHGVKPILGCEMYIVDNLKERKRYHCTVLVKNEVGFHNLNRLLKFSFEEGFYYKNTVNWETLFRHREGLIITSSCLGGKIPKLLKEGQVEEAKKWLINFRLLFGNDFYLEIQPNNLPDQIALNKQLIELGKEQNVKVIATNDIHYLTGEDCSTHEVLLAIQSRKTIYDADRFHFDTTGFYLKSAEEMLKDLKDIHDIEAEEYLKNTLEIANKCNFEFVSEPNPLPIISFKGKTNVELITELTRESMIKKGFDKNSVYEARLQEELNHIITKNLTDFFLIFWDLMKWMKEQNIARGFGRGSSAGSLVSFLLDITKVDPIIHKTMFWRFIDPNRSDLPDIDLDIQDNRRQEVKQYLTEKYGIENVSSICTFSRMRGRSALLDVARALKVDRGETLHMGGYLIQRSQAESRGSFTITDSIAEFEECKKYANKYPDVIKQSMKLEGKIRHKGVHAAGVIITNKPLLNYMPFDNREGNNVTHFDKYDCDSMGLLKMDLLGLNYVTIVGETLNLIKKLHNKEILMEDIPLDDKEVLMKFTNGECAAVFQFETKGMTKLCKNIKIDTFEHLTACNALHRPGTLHSGFAIQYVKRKNGLEKIDYLHDLMIDITKESYGLIIYQEQLMEAVRRLGNFNWAQTNDIRKVMSKVQGSEYFKKYEEIFVNGCKNHSMSEEDARSVWTKLCNFGNWGFNKSHAVSYSLLGYACMWLKNYYPKEYLQSFLKYNSKDDRVKEGIREAQRIGIKILMPSINKSELYFSIEEEGLRFGLCNIKGVKDKALAKVIENKPFKDLVEFEKKCKNRSLTKKVINLLQKSGAFEEFGIPAENFRDLLPLPLDNSKIMEMDTFLKSVTDIPFSKIKEINFEQTSYLTYVRGVIDSINLKRLGQEGAISDRGEGSRYCVCNFEDESDFIMLVFQAQEYQKYKAIIEKGVGSRLIVEGRVLAGKTKIYVTRVVEFEKFKQEPTKYFHFIKKKRVVIEEAREYKTFPDLKFAIENCKLCNISEKCNKKVIGKGSKTPLIMFIGDAPGQEEDKTGLPFVGQAGKLLDKWINFVNINPSHYAMTNVIRCRPESNRKPTEEEIKNCLPFLKHTIKFMQPKLIVALGDTAYKLLLPYEAGQKTISHVSGQKFITDKGNPVIVIMHPSYFLHNPMIDWKPHLVELRKAYDNLRGESNDKLRI